jgi:hypothetical protein
MVSQDEKNPLYDYKAAYEEAERRLKQLDELG